MNHKSYLLEENFDIQKNNLVLFYGENLGLKNDFKEKIKKKSETVLKFTQDQILKNENTILNEIKNDSLFETKKIFFIDDVNDKILSIIEEIQPQINENQVYLFGDILDKKSKLRSYFETGKNCDIVACYKDNEVSIKKLILKHLKEFSGVTPQVLNILVENSNLDRVKLNNELIKIKTYFIDKKIKIEHLDQLLNLRTDDDFNMVKDNALKGNNLATNKLLSSTTLENEKSTLYLNILNQRLNKLKDVTVLASNKNLVDAVNSIKPPIFWKDKPIFLEQAKLWNNKKVKHALNKSYEIELKIKSETNINKNTLIKKLLLDICMIANS